MLISDDGAWSKIVVVPGLRRVRFWKCLAGGADVVC